MIGFNVVSVRVWRDPGLCPDLKSTETEAGSWIRGHVLSSHQGEQFVCFRTMPFWQCSGLAGLCEGGGPRKGSGQSLEVCVWGELGRTPGIIQEG